MESLQNLICTIIKSNNPIDQDAFILGYRNLISDKEIWTVIINNFHQFNQSNLCFKFIQRWVYYIPVKWSLLEQILPLIDSNESNSLKLRVLRHGTRNIPDFCKDYISDLSEHKKLLHEICSAEELAILLTHFEFSILKKIELSEFATLSWTREDKHKGKRFISKSIYFSNQLTNLIIIDILETETLLEITQRISYYIEVASCLYKHRNFNTLSIVISSLQSWAIDRLKRSWTDIPQSPRPQSPQPRENTRGKDLKSKIEELKLCVSSENNYARYRKYIMGLSEPYIPIISLILHDVILSCDGNSPYLNNNEFNCERILLIGKAILPITKMEPLNIDLNIKYKNNVCYIFHETKSWSDDKIARKSYQRECPRFSIGDFSEYFSLNKSANKTVFFDRIIRLYYKKSLFELNLRDKASRLFLLYYIHPRKWAVYDCILWMEKNQFPSSIRNIFLVKGLTFGDLLPPESIRESLDHQYDLDIFLKYTTFKSKSHRELKIPMERWEEKGLPKEFHLRIKDTISDLITSYKEYSRDYHVRFSKKYTWNSYDIAAWLDFNSFFLTGKIVRERTFSCDQLLKLYDEDLVEMGLDQIGSKIRFRKFLREII